MKPWHDSLPIGVEIHSDLSDCPDALVAYAAATGEYGLWIHDGGSSYMVIRHCPWCGTALALNGVVDVD